MNDDDEVGNSDFKLFDVYQLPDGKWEATALGGISEMYDDMNHAILWVLNVIIEAFVLHINDDSEEAHPHSNKGTKGYRVEFSEQASESEV